MKRIENTAHLSHLRRVQAERKAAAIAAKRKAALAAMRAVGGAK